MQRNIEISHVYTDEEMSEIHHRSVIRMKEIAVPTDTVSILLDDYNADKTTIRINDFVKILELTHNIKISTVVYESSLTKNAEKLIQSIPKELLSEESFDRSTKRVTFLNVDGMKITLKNVYDHLPMIPFYKCSVLTAAWQLTRLGVFEFDTVWINRYDETSIYSDQVISVIDSRFKENEMKSMKIIESSKYKSVLDRIHYEFI